MFVGDVESGSGEREVGVKEKMLTSPSSPTIEIQSSTALSVLWLMHTKTRGEGKGEGREDTGFQGATCHLLKVQPHMVPMSFSDSTIRRMVG